MTILDAATVGPCAEEVNTDKKAIKTLQTLKTSDTNLMISIHCYEIYLLLESYSSNNSQRQDLISS